MRSQEQIIGYVLLGVVILGIALAVYNYVVPMIQKSYAKNIVLSAESKLSSLADQISKTSFDFGVSTFQLDIQNSYIEVNPNSIQLKIKSPIQYYSSLTKVPINYEEYIFCPNYTFSLSYSGRICNDNSYINVTINTATNSLTIIDEISGNNITLQLGNYTNVITSRYVFDIVYDGSNIRFIPRYSTGVYGLSSPCIVSAVQLGSDVIYELTCRPVVSLENKICYWIKISPYGVSATQISSKAVLSISYRSYSGVSYISTVCNTVREIYTDISIST